MSEDQTVSVEFELTPEEWAEACTAHSLASPMTRKAVRQMRLLFVLICWLLALMQVLTGAVGLAIAWVIGGLVGQSIFPLAFKHSQRRQLKAYGEMGVANGMFGRHRVELRDDGILDSTTGYEWLTRWESVERVEEVEGMFMIYSGPNSFLPVPASAFPDSASLRAFGDHFYGALADAGSAKQSELTGSTDPGPPGTPEDEEPD